MSLVASPQSQVYSAKTVIGTRITTAKNLIKRWPQVVNDQFRKQIRRELDKIKGEINRGELEEADTRLDNVRDKVSNRVPPGSTKTSFLSQLDSIEEVKDQSIWETDCCCCCMSAAAGRETTTNKGKRRKGNRRRI